MVFVPFVIPGELVRVKIIEEKARFARAELVEVLEPSIQRMQPRCSHFTYCGGCHYQHMSYKGQLQAKSDILREQLERIGGLQAIPSIEIIASAEPWYYRNHIQFHLTREGKLGFQRGRTNHTFAIRECHLPEAAINDTWPKINIEASTGLERISLRVGVNDDLMLILESEEPQPLDFNIEDLAISVVHTGPTGSVVLAGSNSITMEVSGRQFAVSSGSFFQVNTHQAEAMVRYILEALPLDQDQSLVDVYCGVGLFSAFLAPQVKNLTGIEISPEACEDFTYNLDEFENVSLYEAPAEEVLSSVQFAPDVILMDPPREGLGAAVIEEIVGQGAATLGYISCDPATLARDARLLVQRGYSMQRIAMIDMFPQTYHLESISVWGKIS